MSSYGRKLVAQIGTSVRVSADGHPETKIGGITIDWTTIATAPSLLTLTDGVVIEPGDLYLRYGQILCEITSPATATVAITGAPTGGTFTITVTTYTIANDVNGNPVSTANVQTTTAIAEGASAATVQAALVALTNVGANNCTVTYNAGTTTYTLVFAASLNQAMVTASGASLTGGTTPAATATQIAFGGDESQLGGSSIGKYGPYDPTALDGRATMNPGQCFILNRTIKYNDLNSEHPEVLFGGMVFVNRVLQAGYSGTPSLANGPSLQNVFATFPRLQPVSESPTS